VIDLDALAELVEVGETDAEERFGDPVPPVDLAVLLGAQRLQFIQHVRHGHGRALGGRG
jgi:hypothetical protein